MIRKPDYHGLMPHDIDAEMAALGSMMICGEDKQTFATLRRTLWPMAFANEDHQHIFRVICDMDDAGKSIDGITVRYELKQRGVLDLVGGTEHIAAIFNAMPSHQHGRHYAAIVAELARRRDAMVVADNLKQNLSGALTDDRAQEIISRAISELWKLATGGMDQRVWTLAEAMERFVERRLTGDRPIVQLTGIKSLDDFAGIFRFGGYTIVAGRPSMGKSTLLRWMLKELAKAGTRCGLVAVEEDEDKIAGNLISSESEIENDHLAYGKWTTNDGAKVNDAVNALKPIPFFGLDTAVALSDVLNAVEMMVMEHKCKVVAVDHIHLIESELKRDNREQQISDISGKLKALFKRHGIVGIAAAQMNRPEKGAIPPPPHLTDLRGSGALEEHADAVLMIHREDYYYRESNRQPNNIAEVFIRKNRNGCVGSATLTADLKHQRFVERAAEVPSFEHYRSPVAAQEYDPFGA